MKYSKMDIISYFLLFGDDCVDQVESPTKTDFVRIHS